LRISSGPSEAPTLRFAVAAGAILGGVALVVVSRRRSRP